MCSSGIDEKQNPPRLAFLAMFVFGANSDSFDSIKSARYLSLEIYGRHTDQIMPNLQYRCTGIDLSTGSLDASILSFFRIDHDHMKDASTLPTVPTATKAHQQIHYILAGPLDTHQ